MAKRIVIMTGGTAQYTVQRSRFITDTAAVRDEAAAQAFLQTIKKKYYDARHHCYGWIAAGGRRKKSGDDGEPSGTAGAPILAALERQGVTDGLIVVTRYFGGIKLGAAASPAPMPTPPPSASRPPRWASFKSCAASPSPSPILSSGL